MVIVVMVIVVIVMVIVIVVMVIVEVMVIVVMVIVVMVMVTVIVEVMVIVVMVIDHSPVNVPMVLPTSLEETDSHNLSAISAATFLAESEQQRTSSMRTALHEIRFALTDKVHSHLVQSRLQGITSDSPACSK